MKNLVLATRNDGKVREMASKFASLGLEIFTLADFTHVPDPVESGSNLRENALIKLHHTLTYTQMPSLADDSGLEVDFLNGAPGVCSARFAGSPSDDAANNKKLLGLLMGVGQEKRTARFRCVLAFGLPGKETYIIEGTCEGWIAIEPRGSEGFGYDPLFVVASLGKTMAELDLETKNQLSHRGEAVKKMHLFLQRFIAGDKNTRDALTK